MHVQLHAQILCTVDTIYKDGAVFPRPGLAGVPHVQHMGTMDVSWARASPPSSMAMVGQLGGGPTKHLSGLGAQVVSPGPSNPAPQRGRSGGLSPLGGRRCGAPMVGSSSWQGRGDGSPRPPRRGDRSFLMSLWAEAEGGAPGYTIFRVLDICKNLDRVRLLLADVRYITFVNICYIT